MKRKILIIAALLIMSFISISVTSTSEHRPVKEDRVVVENWMTTPFSDFVEETIEVEEWMTKPFVIN